MIDSTGSYSVKEGYQDKENQTGETSGENSPDAGNKGSLVNFFLTLIGGLGLTALLFTVFVKVDNDRVTNRLQRGTDALLTLINSPVPIPNPVLDGIFSTLGRFREEVGPDQEITQELLDSYFWENPPLGLDTSTIEYLPRVKFSETEELSARFGNLVSRDFKIVASPGAGQSPLPAMDEYYPVLFEAAGDQDWGPVIGLDRSLANPLIRAALEQARDTGEVATHGFFPLVGSGDQTMLSHYYFALYDTGTVPDTVAERREKLRGFVSVVSYYPTEAFAAFFPESYQGMETAYFPLSGGYPNEEKDPAIVKGIEEGTVLETPYFLFLQGGAPWMSLTRATPEMVASMVSPTRWWVLSVGILLTAWVSSLMLWHHRQSGKILSVVRERTRDLADRTEKLSEVNQALQESETRYRMLANNATDVIYTHDLDGICTFISPSATQQSGYEVEEYIGRPMTDHLTEESAEKVKASLERLRKMVAEDPASLDKNYIFEYELRCKDGSVLPVENTVSFLRDENGVPNGILGVSRDISERKKTERERQDLEEAYRQSQKMEAIGTLAGGVAHDFNNLLTGILGHTELLKMKFSGNKDASHGLNVIEKAALRAKELTSQLLGFARKGRYQAVPVDLNELATDVSALVERTMDKNIEVSIKLSKKAPMVIGDPGQLSQLILNLAINARDAMPEGGELTFTTRVLKLDEKFCATHLGTSAGEYSVLTVNDTGIGMSRDKMERIFEPFFTDKENGTGTGMGLAMVYGVAKNHGGAVTVESEQGEGTTFNVYLPYSESITSEKRLAEKARELIHGEGKILVVDDESMVRDMARTMLDRLGYQVFVAGDGKEAIQYYRKNWEDIDLVIIDMIMPQMSGIDCLRELKDINPSIKVIMSTGYSRDSFAEKINKDHIQGFLQKPFRMQELSEVVSSTIQ